MTKPIDASQYKYLLYDVNILARESLKNGSTAIYLGGKWVPHDAHDWDTKADLISATEASRLVLDPNRN